MLLITVRCDNCGYSTRKPASSLPRHRVSATCPRCKHTFSFDPAAAAPGEPQAPEPAAPSRQQGKEAAAETVCLKRGLDAKANKVLFAVFLSLVLVTVAVRLWGDARFKAVPYPNLLAASSAGVAVTCGQTVYRLDSAGKVVKRYQLSPDVHPTQLFWDKGSLCLADMKTKSVLVLDSKANVAMTFAGPAISAQFKVAREPATDHLFVSNSASHRISVFDQSGRYLRSFGEEGTGAGQFKFPNEILFDESGLLLVANTKRPAIEVFSADGAFQRTLVTPSGDRKYTYPTDFIVTPDRLLVLENDGFLERAKVRTYDRNGRKTGELATGNAELLGDLVSDGERIYITDCEGRQLLVYSLPDLRPLGQLSPELNEQFIAWRKEAAFFKKVSLGSLAFLFILCAPVLFFYSRIKREEAREISRLGLTSVAGRGAASAGAQPVADLIVATPVNAVRQKISYLLLGTGFFITLLVPLLMSLPTVPRGAVTVLALGVVAFPFGLLVFIRAGGLSYVRRKQTATAYSKVIRDGKLPLQPDERVERVALAQQSTSNQDLALMVFTSKRLLLYSLSWNKVAKIEQIPYLAVTRVVPPSRGNLEVLSALQVILMVEGKERTLKLYFQKTDFLQMIGEEFQRRIGTGSSLCYALLCLSCLEPLQGGYCVRCATKLAPDRLSMWLSLLFPGLGQLRNGELQKGLVFIVFGVFALLLSYVGLKGWFVEGADLNLKDKFHIVTLVVMAPLWYVANAVDAYRSSIRGRKP